MIRYVAAGMVMSMAAMSATAGVNLVVNGDFELGNTGFTTAYGYDAIGTWPGLYSVKNSPSDWDGGYVVCQDHTSGLGTRMLLVDGAGPAGGVAGQIVWSQSVSVDAGASYLFSLWMVQISQGSAANVRSVLDFAVNGTSLGQQTVSNQSGVWESFSTPWHSGTASTATLTIREISGVTAYAGNDFGLDDISLVAVPEPASMSLLTLGGVGLFFRWRRR